MDTYGDVTGVMAVGRHVYIDGWVVGMMLKWVATHAARWKIKCNQIEYIHIKWINGTMRLVVKDTMGVEQSGWVVVGV